MALGNINIILPGELRSLRSIEASGILSLDPNSISSIILDVRRCVYAEPFPLVYLAAHIRRLKRANPNLEVNFHFPPQSGMTRGFVGYAAHIGYFEYLGVQFGNKIGEARGSSRYLPITEIDLVEMRSRAGDVPLGYLMSDRAKELARVLTQKDDGPIFDVMEYSIREIARNALEHSRGSRLVLLAQYWPTKKTAEVAIFDNGVGIFSNLFDNEYVDIANNLAAIKFSLLPGISGVSRSERANQHERWGNSGFGLYVVSALCGKYGNFNIISNDDYLRLTQRTQYHRKYPFRGTGVAFRLELNGLRDPVSVINNIIQEGERIRSEIIRDHPIQASVASKMLASQFDKKIEG